MAFVAQHEAEDVPNTRDGLQQVEGVGLGFLGGLDDGEFQSTEELLSRRAEGSVDRAVLVPSSLVTALGDTLAVGCIGDGLADRRPVRRARGRLDGR
jgi:hypothetical protein